MDYPHRCLRVKADFRFLRRSSVEFLLQFRYRLKSTKNLLTLLGLEAEKLSRTYNGCWMPFASARKLREAVVSFYRTEKRMFHPIQV